MSDGFLSRWSQRKLAAKEGSPVESDLVSQAAGLAETSAPAPVVSSTTSTSVEDLPLPTEADLEQVRQGGDVKAFLSAKVSADLKNKAFKALFSRPEFNQMDGLDIYIDDYNVFTPLTAEDIGKMSMSKQLLSRPDLEEKIQELVALPESDASMLVEARDVEPPIPASSELQTPVETNAQECATESPRVSPDEDSCGSSEVLPPK